MPPARGGAEPLARAFPRAGTVTVGLTPPPPRWGTGDHVRPPPECREPFQGRSLHQGLHPLISAQHPQPRLCPPTVLTVPPNSSQLSHLDPPTLKSLRFISRLPKSLLRPPPLLSAHPPPAPRTLQIRPFSSFPRPCPGPVPSPFLQPPPLTMAAAWLLVPTSKESTQVPTTAAPGRPPIYRPGGRAERPRPALLLAAVLVRQRDRTADWWRRVACSASSSLRAAGLGGGPSRGGVQPPPPGFAKGPQFGE